MDSQQNPYVQNLGFGQYQPGVGGSAQNPYLQKNVNTALDDISRQYQTTTAPAMASRMASANSFGNTGLQQVQTEQDRQFAQTLGNTAANMYGAAYNTDRANDLAFTNANNANTTQRYGYDQSRAAAQYNADQSRLASAYASDNSLKGSMYGADKGYDATMGAASAAAGASMYGSDNALKIANLNNATTQRGQDQSYTLGLGKTRSACKTPALTACRSTTATTSGWATSGWATRRCRTPPNKTSKPMTSGCAPTTWGIPRWTPTSTRTTSTTTWLAPTSGSTCMTG